MTGHPTPDGPPCAHGGDAETVDASVRDMLLLTASALAPDPECGDVDAGLVLGAGRRLGLTPSVLAAAEADGLVRWSGGRVGFTCGRLRAAVYDRAPAARRRAAHAALALASAREGRRLVRLVHVALSVRGPAPRLAAELATEAAREDAGRSHRERASAYLRAAELTAGSGARAERWTAAAEQARLAGASGRAAGLLAVARREGGHASVRGRAELVRGVILLEDGPVCDAEETLRTAAALLDPYDPVLARAARLAAVDAAWAGGDLTVCRAALDAAGAGRGPRGPGATAARRSAGQPDGGTGRGRAPGRGRAVRPGGPGHGGEPPARGTAPGAGAAGPGPGAGGATAAQPGGAGSGGFPPAGAETAGAFDDYLEGLGAALAGRLDLAREPLRRLVAGAEACAGPEPLLRAAAAALVLGDAGAACRASARALAAARSAGSAALVPRALEYLAYGELRAGRHAQARTHAEEGVRAARRAGQRNAAAHLHAVLALAASAEGDASAVARHAAAALDTARRHGLAQTATLARWAVARDELARGHAVEAAARLGPLVGAGTAAVRLGADGTGGAAGHFAVRVLAMPCFVEAAALAGRAEAAGAVVEQFAVWASLGADAQAPAQLARCRALLAPSDAGPWYEEALRRHEVAGGAFERGRTLLLYGKWLRRRRRPREAGTRLREALVEFEECGARSWAEQADSELRAAGSTPRGLRGGAPAVLTAQQLRIARCVAEGATNREVAVRLSLSPRTVDHHLRNVFAVLGVRSRVDLARLVDRWDRSGAAVDGEGPGARPR